MDFQSQQPHSGTKDASQSNPVIDRLASLVEKANETSNAVSSYLLEKSCYEGFLEAQQLLENGARAEALQVAELTYRLSERAFAVDSSERFDCQHLYARTLETNNKVLHAEVQYSDLSRRLESGGFVNPKMYINTVLNTAMLRLKLDQYAEASDVVNHAVYAVSMSETLSPVYTIAALSAAVKINALLGVEELANDQMSKLVYALSSLPMSQQLEAVPYLLGLSRGYREMQRFSDATVIADMIMGIVSNSDESFNVELLVAGRIEAIEARWHSGDFSAADELIREFENTATLQEHQSSLYGLKSRIFIDTNRMNEAEIWYNKLRQSLDAESPDRQIEELDLLLGAAQSAEHSGRVLAMAQYIEAAWDILKDRLDASFVSAMRVPIEDFSESLEQYLQTVRGEDRRAVIDFLVRVPTLLLLESHTSLLKSYLELHEEDASADLERDTLSLMEKATILYEYLPDSVASPKMKAGAYFTLGHVHTMFARPSEGLEVVDRGLALLEPKNITETKGISYTQGLILRARCSIEALDMAAAETALEESEALLNSFPRAAKGITKAYYLVARGQYEAALAEYDTAIVHLEEAVSVCEKLGFGHSLSMVQSLHELAECYSAIGNETELQAVEQCLVETFEAKHHDYVLQYRPFVS